MAWNINNNNNRNNKVSVNGFPNLKEEHCPLMESTSLYTMTTLDETNNVVNDLSLIKLDSDENLQDGGGVKNQLSSDEPYKYLQGLNSDNLMKLSQQSVVMQMINDEVRMQPNINLLPTFEEHDQGGHNFRIKPNTTEIIQKRNTAVYSELLNKLYVKINDKAAIDVLLTIKLPLEPLRVRVFMVFPKDVSEPVLRCQNHLCKDTNENDLIKQSLIRCDQSEVIYCGDSNGTLIKDRYSILIPVNACAMAEPNELRQQILLSFSCNNSCMGRKETCAIFLLENLSGEVLGQRLLHVKICACPRRDRSTEERLTMKPNRKRKNTSTSTSNSSGSRENCKVARTTADCSSLQIANDDTMDAVNSSGLEEISDYGSGQDFMNDENIDVKMEADGKCLLSIRYQNRTELLEALQQLYADAKKKEVFAKRKRHPLCELNESSNSLQSRHFKRAYDKAYAMMDSSPSL